jgi:hypothetical protein
MKADFLQLGAKKFLAGSLIFWLSGIIFLFCCEMPAVQAAEKDSCPLAKASHCNKKTSDEDSGKNVSVKPGDQAFDCCIFPGVFDKARKVEKNPQTSAIAQFTKVSSPVFGQPKVESGIPNTYRPLVLNRSGTYLKNRVFRI